MIQGRCRHRLWLVLLLAGCGAKSHELFAEDAGEDGSSATPDAGSEGESGQIPGCDDDNSVLPETLECTGLYANIVDKKVSKSTRSFLPAFPLWSDGAEKQRWVQLPPDTQIDNSDPNAWAFPAGTKFWKEFKVDGKRIETRLFWKVRKDRWLRGTYAWNEDESQAVFSFGGDIQLPSGPYHLPEQAECDDCHEGQPDRVLGFSAVNLGLSDASGVTLAQLAEEGWLTTKPKLVELSIGADETGLDSDGIPFAAKALGTLHTNCGLTCHNQTASATANLTDQNLRLDVELLDGRAPDTAFNVLRTAVGKKAQGAQWGGTKTRIVPGNPDASLIIELMSHRNPMGKGAGQMPPIASRVVDKEGLAMVRAWISRLTPETPADAGMAMDSGAAMDAGSEAGQDDAGQEMDAGLLNGSAVQDAEPDAGLDADAGDVLDADLDAGDGDASDADPDAGDGDVPDADPDAAELEAGDPDAGVP